VLDLFWGSLVSFAPATAGGEPSAIAAAGPMRLWALVAAPALGGLLSALLVYRFAPDAAGHGTDAAIRAFHREGGRIRWSTPVVKLFASALTLGSGGSAGREGPIAQIGAGFGSLLGTWLKLSERQRSILMMAGVSAGIGAIFRAPFAGAVFAAEVLYREPDIEADVLVPALLSSIVSYTIYCAFHGFGHLFVGTQGFTFSEPASLACYAVLGVVVAFGGIAYITLLDRTTERFKRWRISNYFKPAIGGAAVGTIALAAILVARDSSVLAVMGSGYGTLQRAVSEWSAIGPSLAILIFVAIGKMLTTSLTIGSGGSGGVFGPSMVIGGCLGAAVGTVFHALAPGLVPDVGPFTIVGMAGFFAGVAKTPISTLLMVGELTGNYSLLLPSMLVVCLTMIIAHRWTIYSEQVRTRVESPAHRDELLHDVFADVEVGDVISEPPRDSLDPSMPVRAALKFLDDREVSMVPVLRQDGTVLGVISVDAIRAVISQNPSPGLVVIGDLLPVETAALRRDDKVERALELLALRHVDAVPVLSDTGALLGVLDRHTILRSYRMRIDRLKAISS
jgi:CIC family chloride channel protein